MYLNRWLKTHAQLRPNQIALIDEHGHRTTYAQMYEASKTAAARLQQLGVTAGDRVATLTANRPEFLHLLFGCARVGAILVPLNWRLTKAELAGIVADCDPKVMFVDAQNTMQAPEHPNALSIHNFADGVKASDDLAEVDEDTAVAIFYTGGTTGTPKGAVLTHRSIHWNAVNTITGWGLSPTDVAPVFTPMFHTGGLNVLATPLFLLGGTVVLAGPFKAEDALDLLIRERCTVLFMVPTMFDMLRSAPEFDTTDLSRVRLWISGGAPCPRSLFEAYWQRGLPLRQGYGLTEAGPNNFGVNIEDAKAHLGTVGHPLPFVDIRLVREDGSEAAIGEVGELQVRGPHVMSGYWARPEATAQAIAYGWLHTGDLAYRNKDGFFFICGRNKEMFISGGENVFPAEIEEVLLDHPAVAEAAVIGVPDTKWGEVGRAFIVAKDPANPPSDTELATFCRSRLAGYKVPKQVRIIDSLPKSAAGKILKKLLAEPALAEAR